MARRTLSERNIRRIMKLGQGSMAITLPIEFVRELGWREKQKVTVKKERGALIIRDWKSR